MTDLGNIHRLRPLLCITTLLAVVLLCSCKSNGKNAARRTEVPPRNTEAKYDGIDISSHQGFIDWAKVSSDKNISFVYIKATEGATYRSPHYAHNITQARRHGLLVGSYHYLSSSSTIDEQFKNFSKFALKSVQDLIPMLDVEVRGDWSRSQLIDSVDRFCQHEKPEINWEGEYTIWQYSETGIIPGIDAYVDLCRYRDDAWIDELLLPNDN